LLSLLLGAILSFDAVASQDRLLNNPYHRMTMIVVGDRKFPGDEGSVA
jgi:hypothetical protein